MGSNAMRNSPFVRSAVTVWNAVLTASYQNATAVDLHDSTSVAVLVSKDTNESATLAIRPQWSGDNVSWSDETVEVAGTPASGECPMTAYARRVDVDLAATGPVPAIRFNRLARYFRVQVKAGGTTTAVVTISAVPLVS